MLLYLLRYTAPSSFRLFICPVTKPARRLRLPQSNPPRSSIRPTPIKITELTVSLAPTICSPSRHSHDVKRFIHFGGLLVKERLVVACEGRPSRRRNRGYGAFSLNLHIIFFRFSGFLLGVCELSVGYDALWVATIAMLHPRQLPVYTPFISTHAQHRCDASCFFLVIERGRAQTTPPRDTTARISAVAASWPHISIPYTSVS
mmetsp:Transcript_7683/g.15745  ORF Transcript_7683/g.15745 Transcript_7683/m.15745 type:complete len:203 (+) Transcript_7683:483-1091(+)